MALTTPDEQSLIQLRQAMHAYPELSGEEAQTAHRIQEFLKAYQPDELITGVGGNGLMAIFKGEEEGPTIVIRGDIDALPIPEHNDLPYKTQNPNVAHKCGHDGHATMVAGLAPVLNQNPPQKGKVVLLFQPAEETGQGASQVIEDPRFQNLKPDFITGLHNVPGKPLGTVLGKSGPFAMASRGLQCYFEGTTAHAAEPEKGTNPAYAIADLIPTIQNLQHSHSFHDFTLATLIHTYVGSEAFGTSPGNGALMYTLRGALDEDLDYLTDLLLKEIDEKAKFHGLNYQTAFQEVFPATVNPDSCENLVREAADNLALKFELLSSPFKWSEDFGHYKNVGTSCFFGLGSGISQPVLHDQAFDFPDELIPYGTQIFYQILKSWSIFKHD